MLDPTNKKDRLERPRTRAFHRTEEKITEIVEVGRRVVCDCFPIFLEAQILKYVARIHSSPFSCFLPIRRLGPIISSVVPFRCPGGESI